MNLTGDPIDAYEAHRVGLANQVVPDHELFDTALCVGAQAGRAGADRGRGDQEALGAAGSSTRGSARGRGLRPRVRVGGREGGDLRLPHEAPAAVQGPVKAASRRGRRAGRRRCFARPSAPSCSPARASPCRPASRTSARPGTGLWENVDPMEVAHIDAWRRDPDRFWSFYGAALRVADRQAAERRPPRARRARAARPDQGGDHPEHRPAAPARRHGAADRGARLDRPERLHGVRRQGVDRPRGRAARRGRRGARCARPAWRR